MLCLRNMMTALVDRDIIIIMVQGSWRSIWNISCATVSMSESDISTSVKNGILFLEDPFDQVCSIVAIYHSKLV